MFQFALSFNQSLCAWGPKMNESAFVSAMFKATDCESFDGGSMDDPNMTACPRGPFCHYCSAEELGITCPDKDASGGDRLTQSFLFFGSSLLLGWLVSWIALQ